MYFDSHAHLDSWQDARALEDVLGRARSAGVSGLVAVGGNPVANRFSVHAATEYEGLVRAAVGLDRDEAVPLIGGNLLGAEIDGLRQLLSASPAPVAIGEIGLDYHYLAESASEQVAVFRAQLDLAVEMGRPVVVHSREAEKDTLAALGDFSARTTRAPGERGVVHCFTGTAGFGRAVCELGFCLGFSGIVTFRKSHELRKVVAATERERILAETDCPYLTPEPYRGQRNEPSRVGLVVECLAEIHGMGREEMAAVTTRNARRLFPEFNIADNEARKPL